MRVVCAAMAKILRFAGMATASLSTGVVDGGCKRYDISSRGRAEHFCKMALAAEYARSHDNRRPMLMIRYFPFRHHEMADGLSLYFASRRRGRCLLARAAYFDAAFNCVASRPAFKNRAQPICLLAMPSNKSSIFSLSEYPPVISSRYR